MEMDDVNGFENGTGARKDSALGVDLHYVYITQKIGGSGRNSYSCRTRDNVLAFGKDLDITDRAGYTLIKKYMVPMGQVMGVLEACSEFTEGQMDLDGLDLKVKEICDLKRGSCGGGR